MQPIHLAIGLVEGLVTSAVVSFVWKARPEILELAATAKPLGGLSTKKVLAGLAMVTILTGGVLSWFASTHPDGLEWSMARTSGKEELAAPNRGIHAAVERIQSLTAFLPDYDFRKPEQTAEPAAPEKQAQVPASVVSAGTSVSGLVGAALTLGLVALLGACLKLRRSTT